MYEIRNQMTERILDLTLEIIYLLTGEHYVSVMKPGEHVTRNTGPCMSDSSCGTQNPGTEPPHLSPIHNEQKILELTHRILRLLTGEVPIRCEDVTVHLSMEEWEYVERHKDLYKDLMMEDHNSPGSLGRSTSRFSSPVTSPSAATKEVTEHKTINGRKDWNKRKPWRKQAKCLSYTSPKSALRQEENRTDDDACTRTGHPPIHINDASASREGGDLSDTNIYPPMQHTAMEYPSPRVKEEPVLRGEGSRADTDMSTPTELTQTQYASPHIKDELVSGDGDGEGGDVSDADMFTQTQYPSCRFEEESASRVGGDLSDADVYFPTEHAFHIEGYLKDINNTLEIDSTILNNRGKPDKAIHLQHGQCSQDTDATFDYPERLTNLICNSGLPDHPSVHDGNRTISPGSGTDFCDVSDLVTRTTSRKREKHFSCSECGKRFTRQHNLVEHKRTHTGEKPFQCPECGRCFAQSSSLSMHQRWHKGYKPFSCTDCGKSFRQTSHLITHRRVHTGEKPYTCVECGKCFSSSSNLGKHQRIHSEERPLTCAVRGKCYNDTSSLHLNVHTTEKAFGT